MIGIIWNSTVGTVLFATPHAPGGTDLSRRGYLYLHRLGYLVLFDHILVMSVIKTY